MTPIILARLGGAAAPRKRLYIYLTPSNPTRLAQKEDEHRVRHSRSHIFEAIYICTTTIFFGVL